MSRLAAQARTAVLALLLAASTVPGWAAPAAPGDGAAPLAFEDAREARRFRALAAGLRCVMCQNQSLADSDAMIARELRGEVLALMRRGLDDDEIRAHLVARYGDFVLYRPRVGPATWLLWFGPALFVLLGGGTVWHLARRGTRGRGAVPDDEAQEW